MHDDLPHAVRKTSLADIGLRESYVNRLEGLQIFDVGSFWDKRDRLAGVIGKTGLQEILDRLESLRAQTNWEPPPDTWRHKPR